MQLMYTSVDNIILWVSTWQNIQANIIKTNVDIKVKIGEIEYVGHMFLHHMVSLQMFVWASFIKDRVGSFFPMEGLWYVGILMF